MRTRFTTAVCVVLIATFLCSCGATSATVAEDTDTDDDATTQTAGTDAGDAIALGDALMERITQRTAELAADSPHPLFTRHLRSTEALVRTDWIRCRLLADDRPEMAEATLEHMRRIADGLDGDAGVWDSYAAGRRSLMFAFVSKTDRTLQQYSIRLPEGWEPTNIYPTIVYLHGHVPKPHPLWFTALSFSPDKPKVRPAGEKPELEPHFSIGPWGRGNAGYRDGWEADVWEALADAKATFTTFDPDRMVLCGHSMGGYGTWAIGIGSPDVWAAMCIYSGGDTLAAAKTGLVGNIAAMPVYIWHGGKDRTVTVDRAHDMAATLATVGNKAVVVIDPEAGHMVPRDAKTAAKKWMLRQRRQRPESFSFIADSSRRRSAFGITMRRDPGENPMPEFACTIDGETIRIDSEGTSGMDVQLGDGGFGMTGDVTVIWNGEQAYKGPVKAIRLGDGGGWRRRNRK